MQAGLFYGLSAKRLPRFPTKGIAIEYATEYATEYAIENVRYPIYRKNHTICPDNTSYTPKINDKGTRNMGIK